MMMMMMRIASWERRKKCFSAAVIVNEIGKCEKGGHLSFFINFHYACGKSKLDGGLKGHGSSDADSYSCCSNQGLTLIFVDHF